MKKRHVQLFATAAIAAGSWMVLLYLQSPEETPGPARPIPRAEPTDPEPAPVAPPPVHPAEPAPVVVVQAKPQPKPLPKPAAAQAPKEKRSAEEVRRQQWIKHSAIMAQRFDKNVARIERETDPNKRKQLIRAMGIFVRFDTLATLDWVTTLNSSEEQTAALDAINKHALIGIGAHIEPDGQGYPRIKETTLFSAIESTGQTQPGDVIMGYRNAGGELVSFEGTPMREVAKQLRGQAGTEVNLVMGRPNANGGTDFTYDTVVERSLIVVEPPF